MKSSQPKEHSQAPQQRSLLLMSAGFDAIAVDPLGSLISRKSNAAVD